MSGKGIDRFDGPYAFLSNFYESPVWVFGHHFKNSEAAFQAAKCPEHMDKFSGLNPSEAKRLGRNVKIRPDWEDIKYRVMWAVCFAKFLQNQDLREKLIRTGTAHLMPTFLTRSITSGTAEPRSRRPTALRSDRARRSWSARALQRSCQSDITQSFTPEADLHPSRVSAPQTAPASSTALTEANGSWLCTTTAQRPASSIMVTASLSLPFSRCWIQPSKKLTA